MSAERWYSSFAAPVWPVRSIPNRATASTTVHTIANALIRVIGSSSSEGEPEPQLHNAGLVGHVRVEGRLAVTRVAFRIRPEVRVVEYIEYLHQSIDRSILAER